ncbi:hypothetical protein GSI_12369 [Ganoderma sinense ZZ0214-1]|uniref:Uncharacterized protein n=1 Tax=Ganoderma sinense ZZ0214-1 TaxID=1077348 RepID=A0A2G8RVM0_9APHY|nr:hypothetical protein GSI_12369 [Ganoderma sinense ZZ0214-1]
MAMSTLSLIEYPRRVLFHYDSQLNRHLPSTQEFKKSQGGWLAPVPHDASIVISSNPRYRGTPSEAITRWASLHPMNSHFIFVTHLTVSNYGNFTTADLLAVLDAMPRLEELELCQVNILDPTGTLLVVRPAHTPVRSLKRLALEACNITEGLSDAYYDLLFRFLSLFARIERLRLLATLFRPEHLFYQPNFHPGPSLRLPTVVHLEAEGFFASVLREFCRQGDPVAGLVSLHLSRCFAEWENLYWVAGVVRAVAPTLQHLAFRPNLTASSYGCTELKELEFGLYAHGQPGYTSAYDTATTLFCCVLEALPPARLHHLAFVLDLDLDLDPGEEVSADVVPWAALDAQMNRVCVNYAWPLQVRIDRYDPDANPEARNLSLNVGRPPARRRPRTDYSDQRFWVTRLPTMRHRMAEVHDRVRSERLSVGQYAAPVGIDGQRIAMPGLRSLFDQ